MFRFRTRPHETCARYTLLEIERFAGAIELATFSLESDSECAALPPCSHCLQGADGVAAALDDDDRARESALLAWAPEPPSTCADAQRLAALRETLRTLPQRHRAAAAEVARLQEPPAKRHRGAAAAVSAGAEMARRAALHRATLALADLDKDVLERKIRECEAHIAAQRAEDEWVRPLREAVRCGRVGAYALPYDVARRTTFCSRVAAVMPDAPVGGATAHHVVHTTCLYRQLLRGNVPCPACRGVPGDVQPGAHVLYALNGVTFACTVVRVGWRLARENTMLRLAAHYANRLRLDPPIEISASPYEIEPCSDDAFAAIERAADAYAAYTPDGERKQALARRDVERAAPFGLATWVHGLCDRFVGMHFETRYIVALVVDRYVETEVREAGCEVVVVQDNLGDGPAGAREHVAVLLSTKTDDVEAHVDATPGHLVERVAHARLRPIGGTLAARLCAVARDNMRRLNDAEPRAPPPRPFAENVGLTIVEWHVTACRNDARAAVRHQRAESGDPETQWFVQRLNTRLCVGMRLDDASLRAVEEATHLVVEARRAAAPPIRLVYHRRASPASAANHASPANHAARLPHFETTYDDVATFVTLDGRDGVADVLMLRIDELSLRSSLRCAPPTDAVSLYSWPERAGASASASAHERQHIPTAWRLVVASDADETLAVLPLCTDATLATFRVGLAAEYSTDADGAGDCASGALDAFVAALDERARHLRLEASYGAGDTWRRLLAYDAPRFVGGVPRGKPLVFALSNNLLCSSAPDDVDVVFLRPHVAFRLPTPDESARGRASTPTACWLEAVPGVRRVAESLECSLRAQPPAPLLLRQSLALCVYMSAVTTGSTGWPRLVRLDVDVDAESFDGSDCDSVVLAARLDGVALAQADEVALRVVLLDAALWGARAPVPRAAATPEIAARYADAARAALAAEAPTLALRVLAARGAAASETEVCLRAPAHAPADDGGAMRVCATVEAERRNGMCVRAHVRALRVHASASALLPHVMRTLALENA